MYSLLRFKYVPNSLIFNFFSLKIPPPRPKYIKKLLNFYVKNFYVSRIVCIFAKSYNNSN